MDRAQDDGRFPGDYHCGIDPGRDRNAGIQTWKMERAESMSRVSDVPPGRNLSLAAFVDARDNQAGDFFWRLAYLFSYYLSLVKCRRNEERDLSEALGRDETGKSARRNAGDCGDTGRPAFVRRAGLALPLRRLSGGAIESRQ